MRTLRVVLLGLVLTLSVGAASGSAAAARASVICKPGTISRIAKPCTMTPRCKVGQRSSKARPCNDAVHAAMVDIAIKALAKEVAPITVVTFLDKGLFRLSVTNASSFTWRPPAGVTVTGVTSSTGGRCVLAIAGITCRLGAVASGKCCVVTADFYADGYEPTLSPGGVYKLWYATGTVTTVPWHIPGGFIDIRVDLPVCGSPAHKSKFSTKASPCTGE